MTCQAHIWLIYDSYMPDMSYQATYQPDTRAQIPGSRLHAGSWTRTLHADTHGTRQGPSNRGSERQGGRTTRVRATGSERRGSERRPRTASAHRGPCIRACARECPAPRPARACARPPPSPAALLPTPPSRRERSRGLERRHSDEGQDDREEDEDQRTWAAKAEDRTAVDRTATVAMVAMATDRTTAHSMARGSGDDRDDSGGHR